MGKFRKSEKKSIPGINTGSMSDIVFMFLFFFMVITTIRQATLFVRIAPPSASEVQKLERKNLVSYIYVGEPQNQRIYGTEPRMQLNDQFAVPNDVARFIENERATRNETDRQFLTTSMKVDKKVKMGIVTDIKQELRKVGAYKINYSTKRGSVTN